MISPVAKTVDEFKSGPYIVNSTHFYVDEAGMQAAFADNLFIEVGEACD